MIEITQAELDEAARKKYLINKEDALNIVKQHFSDAHKQLINRPAYDQTIIGNIFTVIESDIKKDIKVLKTTQI